MLRFDWNLLFTVINLLILYFFMRKFLFGRVNKIIEARKTLIEEQFANAREAEENANALKMEYENKLADARSESEKLLNDARLKAQQESEKRMAEADEELRKKHRQAEETIAAERANAMRDMKKEIAGLVIDAAAKVVDKKASADRNLALYDEFLAEAGDEHGAAEQ